MVIIRPLVTEKTTRLAVQGAYVFLVTPRATASEVKKEAERRYHVNVVKTNVINTRGKLRRFKSSVGMSPSHKKVILTLQKGQKIDVMPQ